MRLLVKIKGIVKAVLNRIQPKTIIQVNVSKLAPNEMLKGRCALITGGTSGIGLAIAEAFLNAGANICITGRSLVRCKKSADTLKLKAGITDDSKVIYAEMDVRNVTKYEHFLQKIATQMGEIDILVNNAGTNKGASYMCSEEDYDDILDTNLKGYFFLSRCFGEYMIKNGIHGNILNIASASSLRPADNPYILSKWGVRSLTQGLAKKYIKHGIVVNGLAPGPTATPMLKKGDTEDISLPNNPSARYAIPEEIANMAVVLTSHMGKLIVGDVVYMTGGAGVITFDDI